MLFISNDPDAMSLMDPKPDKVKALNQTTFPSLSLQLPQWAESIQFTFGLFCLLPAHAPKSANLLC